MTQQGLQPQAPASLQAQLLAAVAAVTPGYTANLPGSMIEDISSTDVGAIALIDSAKVELVNSLTPDGANEFILGQLGTQYIGQGAPGQPTNTQVNVVFSSTSIGYVITNGFLVSDGTNAYQVQIGGPITNTGSSAPMTAIAVNPGSFAVPVNTVTTVQTSVPSSITLTVTNPVAGTPGSLTGESWQSFRARVLQSGLAASVGTGRYIKTLIGQLLGAQSNLISVQQASGGLRVVVGGGGGANTFQIANAIYESVADVSTLQGSAINPGARNVTVSLNDYPDTYNVLYVSSPQQTVTMTVTWNTVLTSFTGGAAFPSLVQGPLVAYLNALGIGQVINVLEMNEIFQEAVAAVLDPSLLTRLVFSVAINSVVTAPGTGTYAITGDPESFFFAIPSGITVVQG